MRYWKYRDIAIVPSSLEGLHSRIIFRIILQINSIKNSIRAAAVINSAISLSRSLLASKSRCRRIIPVVPSFSSLPLSPHIPSAAHDPRAASGARFLFRLVHAERFAHRDYAIESLEREEKGVNLVQEGRPRREFLSVSQNDGRTSGDELFSVLRVVPRDTPPRDRYTVWLRTAECAKLANFPACSSLSSSSLSSSYFPPLSFLSRGEYVNYFSNNATDGVIFSVLSSARRRREFLRRCLLVCDSTRPILAGVFFLVREFVFVHSHFSSRNLVNRARRAAMSFFTETSADRTLVAPRAPRIRNALTNEVCRL